MLVGEGQREKAMAPVFFLLDGGIFFRQYLGEVFEFESTDGPGFFVRRGLCFRRKMGEVFEIESTDGPLHVRERGLGLTYVAELEFPSSIVRGVVASMCVGFSAGS